MIDLALLARRLRVRGRIVTLCGAQPQIRTLIERIGVNRLPGVVLADPSSRPHPAAA